MDKFIKVLFLLTIVTNVYAQDLVSVADVEASLKESDCSLTSPTTIFVNLIKSLPEDKKRNAWNHYIRQFDLQNGVISQKDAISIAFLYIDDK